MTGRHLVEEKGIWRQEVAREEDKKFTDKENLVSKEAWRDTWSLWVLDISSSGTSQGFGLQTERWGVYHSWGTRTRTWESKRNRLEDGNQLVRQMPNAQRQVDGVSAEGRLKKQQTQDNFVSGSCALKQSKSINFSVITVYPIASPRGCGLCGCSSSSVLASFIPKGLEPPPCYMAWSMCPSVAATQACPVSYFFPAVLLCVTNMSSVTQWEGVGGYVALAALYL